MVAVLVFGWSLIVVLLVCFFMGAMKVADLVLKGSDLKR